MNETHLRLAHYLLKPLTSLSTLKSYPLKRLEALVGHRYVDLLFHWPCHIRRRFFYAHLKDAAPDHHVALKLKVVQHKPGKPYKILASDGSQTVTLVFFKSSLPMIKKCFQVGQTYVIHGWLEMFKNEWTMIHPTVRTLSSFQSDVAVEPIYALTSGVTETFMRKIISHLLTKMPDAPCFFHASDQGGWSWKETLYRIHHPQTEEDLAYDAPARQRFYQDEILAQQLALQKARLWSREHTLALPLAFSASLLERCLNLLPFQLTDDQKQVLSHIAHDMHQPERMMRLIQGDVGSGKTVLAFLALAQVAYQGYQGLFMAPTTLLAHQHFKTFQTWASSLDIPVFFLTSHTSSQEKKSIARWMETGRSGILVGTHALLQDPLHTPRLGLLVIDEQQRFGVHQRLELIQKNPKAHFLMLSATPIPRTLQLTLQGDLDVSALHHKPLHVQPVKTIAVSVEKLPEIYDRLKKWVEEGHKIYWVCPFIETSETRNHITPCEERYHHLQQLYGEQVGLVHSGIEMTIKQKTLEGFLQGALSILVATTTIEVGVHVPDATIMIIEHAELFGLTQLHQLRGRVGRGSAPGLCILIHGFLTPHAQKRLDVMRQCQDGFEIAEKDLLLRGPGEIFGSRQAGEKLMRLGQPLPAAELIEEHKQRAEKILQNPELTKKASLFQEIFLGESSTPSLLQ